MKNKTKEYKINNSIVRVIFGDITKSDTEVIVSSDDMQVTMSGGVSRAIQSAAGDIIKEEATKFVPAQVGDVVVTTAGALRQKYVFHAITIGSNLPEGYKDDVQAYIIEHSIQRCFQLLRVLGLSSIAFPCIGAGTAQFPYEKVARCMTKAIYQTLMSTSKSLTVDIYLLDKNGMMSEFDFLPFFEWFASYAYLANAELFNVPEKEDSDIKIDEIPIQAPNPKDGKFEDIFISYSRRDSDMARYICGILNELNISYWIDVEGIYSGRNYKEVIVRAITKSKVVLFLSSKNSNKSKNVASEISIAKNINKTIIPIRIDDSQYASHFLYDLIDIQSVNVYDASERSREEFKNAVLGGIAMAH